MGSKAHMTDAEAVAAVVAGQTEVFAVLVARHQDYLFRLIGRHLPGPDTAETAQQTFMEAFECLEELREGSSFKAWLSGIAVKRCADYWRRTKRRKEVTFDPTDPADLAWVEAVTAQASQSEYEALAERREAKLLVERLLAGLDPEDRVAVGLFYAGDLSLAEIGGMLGWGLAKVKVRLHRARKRMAKVYAKLGLDRGEN